MREISQTLPAGAISFPPTDEAHSANVLTARSGKDGSPTQDTQTKLISRAAAGPGLAQTPDGQQVLTGRAVLDAAAQVVGPGRRDTGARLPKIVNGHSVGAHQDGGGTGHDTGEPDQRRSTQPGESAEPMRETGPGGEPPRPPEDLTVEASGDDREATIRAIVESDRAAFFRWLNQQREKFIYAPTLDVPHEALRSLIPEQALRLADDPTKVDIIIAPNEEGENSDNTLCFFVVEPKTESLTDTTILEESDQDECPPGVDPMHWENPDALLDQHILDEHDFVFFKGILNKIGPENDADLYVRMLAVHPEVRRQGIAKSLRGNVELFGRTQGFKYIVGHTVTLPTDSGISNREIFSGLGGLGYNDLPETPENLKQRFEGRYVRILEDRDWLSIYPLQEQLGENPGNPGPAGEDKHSSYRRRIRRREEGTAEDGKRTVFDHEQPQTPEQAYTRFLPLIENLKEQVSTSEDPRTLNGYSGYTGSWEAPDSYIVEIEDPADPSKKYITRVFTSDAIELQTQERRRYEGLVRAQTIDDENTKAHMEHLVAYDSETNQIITTKESGKYIENLTPEDKRHITKNNLGNALLAIETMVQHGIVPNFLQNSRVLIDPETGQIVFTDYTPLEDGTEDPDFPTKVITHAFHRLTDRLYQHDPHDQAMKSASERFREMSQAVIRDHFIYHSPRIAFQTENLSRDEIKAVYGTTAPDRLGFSLTYESHMASSLHDLAVSGEGTIQQKLDQLSEARDAYTTIAYQQVIDRDGEMHLQQRVDNRGNNLILINDHVIQARLALAYLPLTEARIRGEEFTPELRAQLHRNLGRVLEEMDFSETSGLLSNMYPAAYGHLTEVIGMTLLSRQGPVADTPIALPTSEVRRFRGGPDATIPFSYGDENLELDIDWKIQPPKDVHPGDVVVGPMCLEELDNMTNPPTIEDVSASDARNAILYTAGLLRQEALGIIELTPDEVAYLDRVQSKIWQRIETTADSSFGIYDLRERARFK